MLFISDVQYYVPIKLGKTIGSIHLFKITGMLKQENVKLKWNYIWDIIEIDWKEVNMTCNENKINLPRSITIKFRDKFKIRHMMKREPLPFKIILRQGFNFFSLASFDPPNYVPKQGGDAPTLVDNILAQPVKIKEGDQREDTKQENKREYSKEEEEHRTEDKGNKAEDSGQEADEDDEYLEYSDLDFIY